jgi:hypothetical protein
MARFEPVQLLRARLSAEEVHLHSFKGFFCRWERERLSNKAIPLLIEDAALLGHITSRRLIIEALADQIGALSFYFADMDHLGVCGNSACWPVMKYHMSGKDPAFLPHSLYRITAYTGVIIGPPAVAEFVEIMRERGVSILTYASDET